MTETTEIKLGGVISSSPKQAIDRMSIMLWGPSGVGKTTFACTAPGKKLLLNFDPDGQQSLAHRDDVTVFDYSGERASIIDKMKGENPLQISAFLDTHPEYETVILDSATSIGQIALTRAVDMAKSSTIEQPGMHGYTARNAIMLELTRGFLTVTKRHKRNFILICHEDSPTMNSEGAVLYIGVLLSGKLPEHVGLKMSEIWWMHEANNVRKVAVRPCRMHKPMKTRMFVTNKEPEFVLKYNPELSDAENEHTIAKWFKAWQDGDGKKLELPT